MIEARRSQLKAIILVVVVAVAMVATVSQRHTGPWRPLEVAGLAVMVPSFCLWAAARLQLGRSFSMRAEARELVTRGIYSRIRNPIYVFGSLFIAGLFAVLGDPRLYLLFLLIIPMQVIRARRESQVLEAAFGDDYRAYKRGTWF